MIKPYHAPKKDVYQRIAEAEATRSAQAKVVTVEFPNFSAAQIAFWLAAPVITAYIALVLSIYFDTL